VGTGLGFNLFTLKPVTPEGAASGPSTLLAG